MRRSRFTRTGRIIMRRLAVIVLLTFAASLLSGAATQLFQSFAGVDPIAHSDGAPCPDPSDRDHPCGPACPCACCHTQVAVPDVLAFQLSEWLPAFTALGEHISDDLHPKDVAFRIFHPPRA